jgi:hypothetical protein
MDNNELNEIFAKCHELISTADNCLKEMKVMDKKVQFLINEYKTNKRWFREEPGHVTVEDVIRKVFEFAWATHRNYELHPEIYLTD